MSLSAYDAVWDAQPAIRAAVEAAPVQNVCAWDRAFIVALHLANRHRESLGYVDDAIQQVTRAVGFEAKRPLSVLHAAGVWIVVKRGSKRSSSWRGPGPVLVEHGLAAFDDERARGAQSPRARAGTRGAQSPQDEQATGGATRGAKGATRGADGPTRGAQLYPSTVITPRVTPRVSLVPRARPLPAAGPPPLHLSSERSLEGSNGRPKRRQRASSSSSSGGDADSEHLSPEATALARRMGWLP